MVRSYAGRLFVFAALASAAVFVGAAPAAAATPITSDPDPSAIIGGGPVDSCDWPSTVFLENCTGTLIHPEIVVYAAHCGNDRERVWFGDDISSGTPADGAGFSVDTEYCVTNPGYDTAFDIGTSRGNDYAFCKLAEPVLDVPIVPPLMGCETTVLTSGKDVTLVGYGTTDQETYGVKFTVDTVLHYIDDWGAAVIGGGGFSPCAGDSGGPAFVQMPDGTWRAFGIVSGPNFGNCGDAMWFATIFTAIPFIEAESGIDVSACHYGESGGWNPSPSCGDFPLEPGDGSATSWENNCGGGPALEWSSACGPAFDAAEDLLGPSTTITAPTDRERFDSDDGIYVLTVEADIVDAPSGIQTVELVIDGDPVVGSLKLSPPWAWELNIPPGVWDIEVHATDWAGNASSSSVVIGIDEDAPPAPEPSTSSGAEPSSEEGNEGSQDDSSGDEANATAEGGSSSSESSGGVAANGDDGGCGCRSDGGGGAAPLALAIVVLLRRRRRAALALALLAACSGSGGSNDDSSSTSDPTSSSSSSSTSQPSTTEGSSSTTEGSTSSADSSSSGPACEVGTLDCHCTETFDCQEGLTCLLDNCVPCETGTITCPCHFDEGARTGECDEGLYCFGGLCAAPQPCPFLMDGVCDEPQGSGACLIGTDAFDCCATMLGVCEEASMGGACPDGSDPDDCGAGSSSESSGSGSESSSSDGSESGSGSSSGAPETAE